MNEDGAASPPADLARQVPYALGALGVAVVLGGLVFFANSTFPAETSTAGRLAVLALLYGLCASVFVLGSWLERIPAWRGGYSHSLLAGALAGVYYTTYAAHFVPSLRVVGSPVVATGLLAACAAGTLWFARRQGARRVAILALLLAVGAGLLSHVGGFTLVSNAVLAAAAFLFLVRNGWRGLSLAMLAVTYASLAAWLFLAEGVPPPPLYLGPEEFARVAALTLLYWSLFSSPLLWSAEPAFNGRRRAAFLAVNTSFVVGLLGLAVPLAKPRLFSFSLVVLAALLLILAAAVARRWPVWTRLDAAARTLGLVLLVVGALTLRTGTSVALALALVALALAMAAEQVVSVALRSLTLLVALLAGGLACQASVAPGAAVLTGAVFLFTAFWVERYGEHSPRLNPGALFFSAVGVAVWLTITMAHTTGPFRSALLAGLALGLAGAAHLVGLAPAAFLSQAFLVVGYVTFLRDASTFAGPSWVVAVIVGAGLLLSAWWRAQSPARLAGLGRRVFTTLYALANVAVLCVWLRWRLPVGSARAWLMVPAALAVAALLYARWTKDRPMGVLGQAFLLLAMAQFWLRRQEQPWPEGWAMLAPPAALLAVSGLLAGAAATVARALACLMLVVWVRWYVPTDGQFLALEALAVALLWWAGTRGRRFDVALSTVLSTGAAWLFWMAAANHRGALWADLLGFVLLLTQQQLWRRRFPQLVPAALHDPAMVIGVGSLWRWAHLTTAAFLGSAWVALGWAVAGLAACVLGLRLREPFYRQLGLLILLASLVRVVVLGSGDLPTLPRLVSLVAIGVLLLALGFAYDRFRPAPPEVQA